MSTTQNNRSSEAFRVPDGYFETINTRVLGMTTAAHKNPFSTPKGYFATIEAGNWTKKIKKQPSVVRLNILRYSAVAAVFFAVILLTNSPASSQLDTIEDSEILGLVEANWINAYEFELAENINTSDWSLEVVSENTIYEHLLSNPNTMDEYYLLDESFN